MAIFVIPAKAGIQRAVWFWTPAPGLKHSGAGFAGVTNLRDIALVQDHGNVLFPNFEPCSKGSGHLNHPLYNLR